MLDAIRKGMDELAWAPRRIDPLHRKCSGFGIGGSFHSRSPVFFRSVTAAIIMLFVSSAICVHAQGSYPPPTPEGQIRIVAWNIQFLGTRTPARTDEQHAAIAARLVSFDAAVMCIQEVNVHSVLDGIVSAMGPSFAVLQNGNSHNSIIYDQSKVRLASVEWLDKLTLPPYSTYYTDYPQAQSPNFPFVPGIRILATAVFEPVTVRARPFRVVGSHFHWASSLCRTYEGRATNIYVQELLSQPEETPYIFVGGDYNDNGSGTPNSTLIANGTLALLANNVSRTHVNGDTFDHFSVTQAALARIANTKTTVMTPSLFWETNSTFDSTYSDHFPIFVEFEPEPLPDPTAAVHVSVGSSWLEEGQPLTLEATVANATGTVEYQWFKDSAEIQGAVSSTLRFDGVTEDDAGLYAVRVTDETPAKNVFYSNSVLVTVFPVGSLPFSTLPVAGVLTATLCCLGAGYLRRFGVRDT